MRGGTTHPEIPFRVAKRCFVRGKRIVSRTHYDSMSRCLLHLQFIYCSTYQAWRLSWKQQHGEEQTRTWWSNNTTVLDEMLKKNDSSSFLPSIVITTEDKYILQLLDSLARNPRAPFAANHRAARKIHIVTGPTLGRSLENQLQSNDKIFSANASYRNPS